VTTILPVRQTCAVCGAVSEHEVLGSTNTMGPPDLDMRPAPMARWTLGEQIQQCPECGYCAKDISEGGASARRVVANDAYQAELAREAYPELTRRYLCASLIMSIAGDDAGAGRAALMGAWAADDVASAGPGPAMGMADDWGSALPEEASLEEVARRLTAAEAAAHCRRLAIGYFEADLRSGPSFAADEDTADAMLADLHRRVGDFEAAKARVKAGIARGAGGLVLEVFRYQLLLCDLFDTACHNADEIGTDQGFNILLG
jgi:hypothetical protein